jgi:hypothetical protein
MRCPVQFSPKTGGFCRIVQVFSSIVLQAHHFIWQGAWSPLSAAQALLAIAGTTGGHDACGEQCPKHVTPAHATQRLRTIYKHAKCADYCAFYGRGDAHYHGSEAYSDMKVSDIDDRLGCISGGCGYI